MIRCTQYIEECCYCGKIFDDGKDYWKDCPYNIKVLGNIYEGLKIDL